MYVYVYVYVYVDVYVYVCVCVCVCVCVLRIYNLYRSVLNDAIAIVLYETFSTFLHNYNSSKDFTVCLCVKI